MRRFLSPGERRFLEQLEPYPAEQAFVRELMDDLDARLIPSEEPETVGSMAAQLEIQSGWGGRRRRDAA